MKKLLLISSIVLILGLLIAGLATPIFAHGTETPDGDWEDMESYCHGAGGMMEGWDGTDGMMGRGMMEGWDGADSMMDGHMGRSMMGR